MKKIFFIALLMIFVALPFASAATIYWGNYSNWTDIPNSTQFYNHTSISVAFTNTQITNNNASWSSTFNNSYQNVISNPAIYNVSYESTFNQTYALNGSYNHTSILFNLFGTQWYNHTLTVFNAFGKFWYNSSETDYNRSVTRMDSQGWNSTYNVSYESTYNITTANYTYNQTLPAKNYSDSLVTLYNSTWSSIYNQTYESKYNATTANYTYNQTIPAVTFVRQKLMFNRTTATINTASLSLWNTSIFTLSLAAQANYSYQCEFAVDAAAITTGGQINISVPTGIRWYTMTTMHPTTATAYAAAGCMNATGLSCMDASTASVTSSTAPLPVHLAGEIETGAAGVTNFQLQSSVNGSNVRVERGGYCEFKLMEI